MVDSPENEPTQRPQPEDNQPYYWMPEKYYPTPEEKRETLVFCAEATVTIVTGPGVVSGIVKFVRNVGAKFVAGRLLKSAAEEAIESQMTGRTFDPINVGLDAVTEMGDELYTAWKVGDPVDKPTNKAGRYPVWETVRRRFWKNRAAGAAPGEFTEENLQRMSRGLAPQHPITGQSMHLHHINGRDIENPHSPQNLQPMWPNEHYELHYGDRE